MLFRKVEESEICSEDANLWVKIHNIPYVLTHRNALFLNLLWQVVRNLALFTVLEFAFALLIGFIIGNIDAYTMFFGGGGVS